MIFQETIDWVLNVSPHTGQPKTSTLRLIKNNEWFIRADDPSPLHKHSIYEISGTYILHQMCRRQPRHGVLEVQTESFIDGIGSRFRRLHKVGQKKAVQRGRGKLGEGTSETTGIKLALPSTLTNLELHAEGFDTRERFEAVWERLHGKDKLKVPCWLIEFRKVGAS